jgi:hypothetical protein
MLRMLNMAWLGDYLSRRKLHCRARDFTLHCSVVSNCVSLILIMLVINPNRLIGRIEMSSNPTLQFPSAE